MNIKNRLKAVEVKLKPIQQDVKVFCFSITGYDDDTDLLGYDCNGLTVTRHDDELRADFAIRAQSIFIAESSEKFCLFLQPIYNRD